MVTAIENARIVTPTSVIDGRITIEGDRIAAVGPTDSRGVDSRSIDARGRFVLPGLIDIHGDGIERHVFPRTNARIETPSALVSADRENVAAGITTKFHALAFEEAPEKNRSREFCTDVIETLPSLESLLIDHRVHARCEISDASCVDETLDVLRDGRADLVSVMNHVPGRGQFRDSAQLEERYEQRGVVSEDRLGRVIEKRRRTVTEAIERRIERIVDRAAHAGVPVASHDDEHPRDVERASDRGIDLCEYPVTMAAAERARDLGLVTAMGAPNLVRGGSLWGNLAAEDAIAAGVVDLLCSDYHPRSLLASIFVDTSGELPDRVRRVTTAPADAVGFSDRGRIEPGARADLVVVDRGPPPVVHCAFVGGELVYRTG